MVSDEPFEQPEDATTEVPGMPKSLQGRISTRSVLMNSLRSLIASMNQEDEEANPVFFTAAGQISCDFVEPNSDDPSDELFNIMYRTNLDMIRSMEETEVPQVIGSASYILVRDAVLQPWGAPRQKYHYERMCIFVDDILGFTIRT